MNDKAPQSRLAREREIEVRVRADQSETKVSKVFSGLSDRREKLSIESVFGSVKADDGGQVQRSPVKVEVVRRRSAMPKPGSSPR